MSRFSGYSKRRLTAIGLALAAGGLAVGGLGCAGGGLAVFEVLHAAQATTGPVARYDMRAGTTSGMGAMMGGSMGGGGGMGGAMGMMFGGGNRGGPTHDLTLELGSSQAPQGAAPNADHFMPAGARLGASVPLETPEKPKAEAPSQPENPQEREFRRPQGRMLIFWGCGDHSPPGQPVVIDFANMAAGQMPQGLFSGAVPLDRWVNPMFSRTYGHWPNSRDRKTVSPDSSLPGAHRVVANYAPPMAFTLAHDFMAPLAVNTTMQPGGAVLMQWNLLPDATGYYASLIGGKGNGQKRIGDGGQMQDLVWWSSSASREFGGGLSDWLSPGTVARLVSARTVMSPQTATCTIPAEVHAAASTFMMTTMIGYGPEERFAYPARPADPRAVWHIEWEARIRHRSITSFMPGMPTSNGMLGRGNAGSDDRPRQSQQDQPCQPKKKRGFGGLGGMIGGVLGAGGSNDGC